MLKRLVLLALLAFFGANAAYAAPGVTLPGADVQMLWGERRGAWHHRRYSTATDGAPPCRNIVILTRAGPSPLSSRIAQSSLLGGLPMNPRWRCPDVKPWLRTPLCR